MEGGSKMKKMLPILIGLLIVGVAAYYFLIKKKDETLPATTPTDDGSSGTPDLHDTDSIIDSLSLSSDLNKQAKNWVRSITNAIKKGTGGWDQKKVETQASDNGITYAQQVVLSALWQMYVTAKIISVDQYRIYQDEMYSL